MRGIRSAAVAGLGLIGGSLARDLAAQGVRVLGYDRDPATLRAAQAEGVVERALGPALEGVEEAEVLVLAVPVTAAEAVLAAARPRLGRALLVTDAGSTKRAAIAAAERLGLDDRFVGAHPYAGDHRSGWAASRTGLFAGAPLFLCPAPAARPRAVALAEQLWSAVGARVRLLPAEEHDRLLAWTSHLPQAVSSALGRTLHAAGITREMLGRGGRDVTRLAASSPEMWTGIALENADHLSAALAQTEAHLRELRLAIEAHDAPRIEALLRQANAWAAEEPAPSASAPKPTAETAPAPVSATRPG